MNESEYGDEAAAIDEDLWLLLQSENAELRASLRWAISQIDSLRVPRERAWRPTERTSAHYRRALLLLGE